MPHQEFEMPCNFVASFHAPALPCVSVEFPCMYLTLFEFYSRESEFVFIVCYQILRQSIVGLSVKIYQ